MRILIIIRFWWSTAVAHFRNGRYHIERYLSVIICQWPRVGESGRVRDHCGLRGWPAIRDGTVLSAGRDGTTSGGRQSTLYCSAWRTTTKTVIDGTEPAAIHILHTLIGNVIIYNMISVKK